MAITKLHTQIFLHSNQLDLYEHVNSRNLVITLEVCVGRYTLVWPRVHNREEVYPTCSTSLQK